MDIETRLISGVTVLTLQGKLTIDHGATDVRKTVRDLIQRGQKSILLNLAGVDYMDSSGLESLIGSYATVLKTGGSLKFSNLTPRAHYLLDMTKLLTILDTYTDEQRALDSFFGR